MWVYIFMQFSRTKKGAKERNKFQKELKSDGFKAIYSQLYVRYCQNLEDSIKHRKRIEKIICDNSKVSIILVGDKQNEYSYHHLSHKRNEGFLLNPPENVEFF